MNNFMGRFDPLRKTEIAVAVLVAVMGSFVAYYSYHTLGLGIIIAPGAGFQPFLLGLALTILGMVWFLALILIKKPSPDGVLLEEIEEDESGGAPTGRSWKHILGFFLVLAFAFLLERMGFALSVTAFMLCWQLIVEKAKWTVGLLIALVTGGVVFVLFRILLKLPLPQGSWFS